MPASFELGANEAAVTRRCFVPAGMTIVLQQQTTGRYVYVHNSPIPGYTVSGMTVVAGSPQPLTGPCLLEMFPWCTTTSPAAGGVIVRRTP
jgi:hypothetical protein